MTQQSVLSENDSIVLDGSGDGTLQMKPWGGAVIWQPQAVAVKCSSNTKEASARIYVGPSASDPYFVDGTLSGSTGDSTGKVSAFQVDTHGNTLWVVWTGGDAGATATAQVSGTVQTP